MNTTAEKIMTFLANQVRAKWAGRHGASVSVAENPAHAIDLLTAGQNTGCAVVIFYMSDEPASDIPGNPMLDATFRVGIVQKVGLAVRGAKGAFSVLGKVDDFRKWMARNMAEIEDVAGPLEYGGMSPVQTTEGRMLNGYALTYTATYAFDV